VALSRETPLPPVLIAYINRLSDLLFTLARAVNREAGVEEIPW
jgi:cob(I)alamin adenosyltransferase